MVDKLIRGKIIEIMVVIVFVLLSIPVWQTFEEKISAANVTTLDDYNIDFFVSNELTHDRINVNNDYYINKNYTIYLKVNKNLPNENSSVVINDKTYKLDDFYYKKEKNNYVYTLVNEHIVASSITYDIKPVINDLNNNYSYIFEEKNIF